jgi:hypothetical protein
MRKYLPASRLLLLILLITSSCGPRSIFRKADKRSGHWYDRVEKGYNKDERRVMRRWNLH